MADLIAFYDQHPINEAEVLSKLAAAGKDVATLTVEDLFAFDQDHYGGLESNDALIAALQVTSESRVLDVCSGMGGPARYAAWKTGCTVHGVDLTASRVAGAQALTARVGLADRVTFAQSDAARLDLPEASFDGAMSQEAFLHITAKAGLLGGILRVLKPHGRLAFTDLLAGEGLSHDDRSRLAAGIHAVSLLSGGAYENHLREAGFAEVKREDLSGWWSSILRDRLEMYRSLEEETVKRFGRARHETYMADYEYFVHCIESGRLRGARFTAVR